MENVRNVRSLVLIVLAGLLGTSPAGSSGAAETHRFVPQIYYTTYSAAHPPALRIRPGDRVSTKTVDARGADGDGKQVTPGGNPETGPFYVEGAEPDDLLVVTLEKIEPNRATAYSGNLLAPSETAAGTVMWTIAFINLAFGYAVSILVGVISVWRRRRADLAVHALAMPIYWLLISFAAYRALYQLARDPYLWEKTEHGVGS